MDDLLRSEIVGTAGLTVAVCAALVLTWRRRPHAVTQREWERTGVIFGLALLLQIAHFAEEFYTGFYLRLPPMFGLVPWSPWFFLSLNVFWLTIWVCCIYGLSKGSRLALFPVWFFAVAAIGNGVAHPLLALRAGGYFPGLVTSSFVGAAGGWVWGRLIGLTRTPITGPEYARIPVDSHL